MCSSQNPRLQNVEKEELYSTEILLCYCFAYLLLKRVD